MNLSHASVYPVEEVPMTEGGGDEQNTNVARVRVKGYPRHAKLSWWLGF